MFSWNKTNVLLTTEANIWHKSKRMGNRFVSEGLKKYAELLNKNHFYYGEPNNALLRMKYYAMESQLQLINLKYKAKKSSHN